MAAAFVLVLSLGLSYGYALHLSDVTGVTDPRPGGYEDNSGYLDGDTRQGEPMMPGTSAQIVVWGRANKADVSVDGDTRQGEPVLKHIVVWGRANKADVSVDGRQGYDDIDHAQRTNARP